jgi:hypothetical protein
MFLWERFAGLDVITVVHTYSFKSAKQRAAWIPHDFILTIRACRYTYSGWLPRSLPTRCTRAVPGGNAVA